jgi:hypothetical protein
MLGVTLAPFSVPLNSAALPCSSSTGVPGPGGVTDNVAEAELPLYDAVIITGVVTPTIPVLMVKAAETEAPAATKTVGGTVTAALLLLSVTTIPADTGPARVTVLLHVAPPPKIVAGDNATDDTIAAG